MTTTVLPKMALARDQLRAALIERDAEIDCALRALCAGEHLLFVGEPGVAKSYLLNQLSKCFSGVKYFHILMSKTTNIEEVMGPWSIKGFKEDRFERVFDTYLPDCALATLDEIWKSSSAVINATLTALEERKVRNGKGWMDIDLRMASAASNEWPVGEGYEGMQAAFDRFLIRKHVRPVSPARRHRLLYEELPQCTPCMDMDDVNAAIAETSAVTVSESAVDALDKIISSLNHEGIRPGDRRLRKAIKVAKAEAWLNGSAEVLPEHLEPLKDVLWEHPEEQPAKCAEIVCKIASPISADVMQILVEFDEVISKANPSNLCAETLTAQKKLRDCVARMDKLAATKNNKAVKASEDVKARLNEFSKKLVEANT